MCDGAGICKHNRVRYTCVECDGPRICKHERLIHHICRDSQGQITDLHERIKEILKKELDKAKKYGKFESS